MVHKLAQDRMSDCPSLAAWLIALPDGRHRTGRGSSCEANIDLNAVACEDLRLFAASDTNPSPAECRAAADRICGLAAIEPMYRHGPLDVLSVCERRQIAFWRWHYSWAEHFDEFYIWKILRVHRLPVLEEHHETTRKNIRLRTIFCNMEYGHSARLCNKYNFLDVAAESIEAGVFPLGLRLPSVYILMLASGLMDTVVLPHASKPHSRSMQVGWSFLPHGTQERFVRKGAHLELLEDILPLNVLDPAEMLSLCDELRGIVLGGAVDLPYLSAWVQSLHKWNQEQAKTQIALTCMSSRRRMFDVKTLLHAVLLCEYVHRDANLRDVVIGACRLVLPPAAAVEVERIVESELRAVAPSPPTISRARAQVDAALMLCMRDCLYVVDGTPKRVCLMVDSSPQGGRDYELALAAVVSVENLCKWQEATDTMFMWAQQSANSDSDLKEHLATLTSARALYTTHALPPVVIGRGRSSLSDKVHAVLHALRLESKDIGALVALLKSVCAITTDFGVEAGLARIEPISVFAFFPHETGRIPGPGPDDFEEPSGLHRPLFLSQGNPDGEDDFEDLGVPVIDFSGCVDVAGMLHIVHNMTEDLSRCMKNFEPHVTQLQEVCNFVATPDLKRKLLGTCYARGLAVHMRAAIEAYSHKLQTIRWGSVAVCVEEIYKIRRELRFGWSRARFEQQGAASGRFVNVSEAACDSGHKDGVKLQVVDAAIASEFFWEYNRMLLTIMKTIKDAIVWIESCHCHHRLLQDTQLPARERVVYEQCPARGRRLPEVAAGDFLAAFGQSLDAASTRLLLTMHRDLTARERQIILDDHEQGKAHVSFVLALKTSHFQQKPWLAYGVGHHDIEKAHSCLARCLEGDCDHPFVRRLHTQPLKGQAERWMATKTIAAEDTDLKAFIGECRFVWLAERPVEGQHAKTHKRVLSARHHSEAYVSIGLRACELRERLKDQQFILQMCDAMRKTRTPRLATLALGFKEHPTLVHAAGYRDPELNRSGIRRSCVLQATKITS